jgi:hypothetical protein
MDPSTRALLVDFALALGSMVLGGLATPGLSASAVLIAAIGLAVILTVLALTDHTAVLALLDDRRPLSFVLVAAGLFALALVLILGRLLVPTPSGPLLVGMGVGLAAYRTVFGLVRPLPDARLAHRRFEEWE